MTASLATSDATELVAFLVPVTSLDPNPDQPRQQVDEARLAELTASVRARGRLIEPLVVRRVPGGRYEIVCGERRWRAAVAAELADVPVVVRDLSDDEAFEESLIENIDRETMALIDEVRAVARVASAQGVQETARRLGKPHSWVSKRKRIADAPPFVLALLEAGQSADVEAFYELAKLAEVDLTSAEALVAGTDAGNLRERVKDALRAVRADSASPRSGRSHANGDPTDEPDEDPGQTDRDEADHEDDAPEREQERRRDASDIGLPGPEQDLARRDRSAGVGRERDDDEDAGDDGAPAEPPWRSSDAPELDEPFDRDDTPLVVSVEARRAGHIVLRTARGAATYQFSDQARVQLRALLFPEDGE